VKVYMNNKERTPIWCASNSKHTAFLYFEPFNCNDQTPNWLYEFCQALNKQAIYPTGNRRENLIDWQNYYLTTEGAQA